MIYYNRKYYRLFNEDQYFKKLYKEDVDKSKNKSNSRYNDNKSINYLENKYYSGKNQVDFVLVEVYDDDYNNNHPYDQYGKQAKHSCCPNCNCRSEKYEYYYDEEEDAYYYYDKEEGAYYYYYDDEDEEDSEESMDSILEHESDELTINSDQSLSTDEADGKIYDDSDSEIVSEDQVKDHENEL